MSAVFGSHSFYRVVVVVVAAANPKYSVWALFWVICMAMFVSSQQKYANEHRATVGGCYFAYTVLVFVFFSLLVLARVPGFCA